MLKREIPEAVTSRSVATGEVALTVTVIWGLLWISRCKFHELQLLLLLLIGWLVDKSAAWKKNRDRILNLWYVQNYVQKSTRRRNSFSWSYLQLVMRSCSRKWFSKGSLLDPTTTTMRWCWWWGWAINIHSVIWNHNQGETTKRMDGGRQRFD